ncbi:MAG: flagellar motor switch phosphatase FliY [Synergistaceae bacterium]|jgi:flagellar motor switch protein FliN/FliY|nr:flagellar motor switch phosphatase FliY [Synergistaceae bacterium]
MDELLSQDEINALLSGGSFTPSSSSDLSMEDSQVLDEVGSVFSNSESSVFGMLAGKDVNAKVEETKVMTQAEFKGQFAEAPFLFRATFGGFDDMPLAFVVDVRGALTLADLMMGGEGKELPESPSELYLNAAQEGLSQVLGSSFTSLSSGLLGGRRLMPENTASALQKEDWLPFTDAGAEGKIWVSSVKVEIDGLEPFSVWTVMPAESAKNLAQAIHQVMNASSAPAPSVAAPAPAPAPAPSGAPAGGGFAAPASAPSMSMPPVRGAQQPGPMVDVHPAEFTPLAARGPAGASASRIDLIADIPVRVTVELGKTRKNISEILNMTTGSVIELDKMAGEPVDVLVNGKLIARGEVVVIDENFGVRITEVLNAASKTYAM